MLHGLDTGLSSLSSPCWCLSLIDIRHNNCAEWKTQKNHARTSSIRRFQAVRSVMAYVLLHHFRFRSLEISGFFPPHSAFRLLQFNYYESTPMNAHNFIKVTILHHTSSYRFRPHCPIIREHTILQNSYL